jgi:LmbE family N-acetylglucosaminyl deacetylase
MMALSRPEMWLTAALVGVVARLAGAADLPLQIATGERLVVVSPHPDDETLGAGGLIERVVAQGGSVRELLVTAGDGYVEAVVQDTGLPRPRPDAYVRYGVLRLAEARAALKQLGGERARLQLLGFPDGGLEPLLQAHWRRPERSATTHDESPPYPDAFQKRVAYDGEDLRRELVALFRESQPTLIALPDPLDRHPDHHASGVFALLALADWIAAGAPTPRIVCYLVHWPGWPPGWDSSAGIPLGDEETLAFPNDFPARGFARATLALDGTAIARKRGALALYETQQALTPSFLAAFVRRTEPFTIVSGGDLRRVNGLLKRLQPDVSR